MSTDKPTEVSKIKLKHLNSIARPDDRRGFSPLEPTADMASPLALVIYMFFVLILMQRQRGSDIESNVCIFIETLHLYKWTSQMLDIDIEKSSPLKCHAEWASHLIE